MEAPDRDQREYELAAAVLILWILMDTVWSTNSSWSTFLDGFNKHVRPVLTRIYGVARAGLAQQFGHEYPAATNAAGNTVIQIPNLNRTIDQYAQDLYRTFQNRHTDLQQRKAEARRAAELEPDIEPPVVTEFGESDAERIAVTTTTEIHSHGEMDAARDVESRRGQRLVAVWMTEAGACPRCSRFHGTTRAWQIEFPNGPPVHPHCVLGETPVNVPGLISVIKAHYHGTVVRFRLDDGSSFGVTPNHMLLTAFGLIRAIDIVEGSYVVRAGSGVLKPSSDPHDDGSPLFANEIFDTASVSCGVPTASVPVSPEYLHGDARFANGNIDIVRADGLLGHCLDAQVGKPVNHNRLQLGRLYRKLFANRDLASMLRRLSTSSDLGVGSIRESRAIGLGELCHANEVSLRAIPNTQPRFREPLFDRLATNAKAISDAQNAFPGKITFAQVVDIQRDDFSHSGVPVFDFETESSLYTIGSGIISSNCRCHLEWRLFLE